MIPHRRDPDYDDPMPLSWADLGDVLRLLPVALLVLIALWAFCSLLFAMAGPAQ